MLVKAAPSDWLAHRGWRTGSRPRGAVALLFAGGAAPVFVVVLGSVMAWGNMPRKTVISPIDQQVDNWSNLADFMPTTIIDTHEWVYYLIT